MVKKTTCPYCPGRRFRDEEARAAHLRTAHGVKVSRTQHSEQEQKKTKQVTLV